MPLAKELLEILVCQKCKGNLVYAKSPEGLICKTCRLFYEVKEDIPNMLPEEAKSLDSLSFEDKEGDR